MTTKKHHPASKKRTTHKASKKASKKPAAKKPSAKSKPLPAKVSTKVTAKSAVRRNLLAKEALKFVDEAASVLRIGIRKGAKATVKSRIVAKRKAHNLLGKASKNLSKAIEESASTLQDLIKTI